MWHTMVHRMISVHLFCLIPAPLSQLQLHSLVTNSHSLAPAPLSQLQLPCPSSSSPVLALTPLSQLQFPCLSSHPPAQFPCPLSQPHLPCHSCSPLSPLTRHDVDDLSLYGRRAERGAGQQRGQRQQRNGSHLTGAAGTTECSLPTQSRPLFHLQHWRHTCQLAIPEKVGRAVRLDPCEEFVWSIEMPSGVHSWAMWRGMAGLDGARFSKWCTTCTTHKHTRAREHK